MGRPAGKRTTNITLFLSAAEAEVADLARVLDGGGTPMPRSSWVMVRAVERLRFHAGQGDAEASAALTALELHYALQGAAVDGKRPAKVRVTSMAPLLEGLRDLAAQQGHVEARLQAQAALDRLRGRAVQE